MDTAENTKKETFDGVALDKQTNEDPQPPPRAPNPAMDPSEEDFELVGFGD